MRTYFALLKKEIRELMGTKKLLILGVLFLFAAIVSPITAKLLPQILKGVTQPGLTITIPTPTYRDAIDQFMKNTSQLLAFVLIFVAAGAIADEKVKKTLELLLTKPISRGTFILAKATSYLASITVLFGISLLIFYVYTVSIFGSFGFTNLFELSLLVLILLLLVTATLLFASTIASSSLIASGIGFLAYIFYSAIWGLIGAIADYSPGYIVSHYKEVLLNGWNRDFLPSVITSLVLIFLMVILSIYAFKRQEVER